MTVFAKIVVFLSKKNPTFKIIICKEGSYFEDQSWILSIFSGNNRVFMKHAKKSSIKKISALKIAHILTISQISPVFFAEYAYLCKKLNIKEISSKGKVYIITFNVDNYEFCRFSMR